MTLNKTIKRRYYLFLPLFAVFISLFFLCVVEAGFQLYNYLKSENDRSYYSPSLCCGYKLKKNYYKPPIRIDHRGFRKTPFDFSMFPDSKVYKIIIMGGAPVFGSVNAEFLTYPSYLELILNSPLMKIKLPGGKSYVDVINAAIPTYTIHPLKYYLKDTILKLNPDMVVISIGTYESMPYEIKPVLLFLYKHVPLFRWYSKKSFTFPYIRKVLSLFPFQKKPKLNGVFRTRQVIENEQVKLEYEDNLRKIAAILKEEGIIPVLMPWAIVPGANKVNDFKFDDTQTMDEHKLLSSKVYAQIMEKVSKEFDIPFVKTPLQLQLVPAKHNAKFFTTAGWHINNYGNKIIGLSLANAIKGILEGKTNEEIYMESFASKPDADLLDIYSSIVMTLESFGKVMKKNIIEALEKQIADYCIKHTKEDMSIPNYHFSECFFAIPDTAFYQIRQRHFTSAKHYLDYAVDRYPKWAYANFIYGLYHLELGNHNEAELFFKKTTQLAPSFKTARQYLNRSRKILEVDNSSLRER